MTAKKAKLTLPADGVYWALLLPSGRLVADYGWDVPVTYPTRKSARNNSACDDDGAKPCRVHVSVGKTR